MPGYYPEHERMKSIKPQADIIAAFLEWLLDGKHAPPPLTTPRRLFLATFLPPEETGEDDDFPVEVNWPIEKMLAAYFGIDLAKVETEKQMMLAELRKNH